MSWLITPRQPVAIDPYFSSVSLLLHGNGTNGSTSIIDSSPSPKTVTAVDNAQISTVQSRFGGASIALDGSGDAVTTGPNSLLALGTGNFTVEAFIYPLSTTTTLASSRALIGNSNLYWVIGISNGQLQAQTRNTAGTQYFAMSPAGAISTNAWYHVAFVRFSNVLSVYVNGVAGPTTANDGGLNLSEEYVAVGLFNYVNFVASFHGYMDDFRITKGIARYTASFAPPTAPFPDA